MTRRILFVLLILLLVLLLLWWRWPRQDAPDSAPTAVADCAERAQRMVATWKAEGRDALTIDKLLQAQIAKCSGVVPACAAMVGAANADLAWVGRALLSGSLTPADYLARVHDRTRKMREFTKNPALCDAYARGDADGDMVPDELDSCPNTPSLAPTNASGCPDTTLPPAAPSSEAVQKVVQALKIPMSKACMNAPLPERSAVLMAGLAPDRQSFLVVVSPAASQPAGCPMFYEVEVRIRNVSFFQQVNSTTVYHRVFRPANALQGPPAPPDGLTFQLAKADPAVPWSKLTFHTIEPGEISERYFRVRSVNGNGSTQGWGAFMQVPSTAF